MKTDELETQNEYKSTCERQYRKMSININIKKLTCGKNW